MILPTDYTIKVAATPFSPQRGEHTHEEDFEREARRMKFLASQAFQDRQLEEPMNED